MAAGKNIKASTLEEWKQNFQSNRNLPFITNSASISLDQLENFITEVRQKCSKDVNGIKLQLVRFQVAADNPAKLQAAGGGFSQVSLVLIPVKNYDPSSGTSETSSLDSGEVYSLTFSDIQATDPGDTTVLCPPKCG